MNPVNLLFRRQALYPVELLGHYRWVFNVVPVFRRLFLPSLQFVSAQINKTAKAQGSFTKSIPPKSQNTTETAVSAPEIRLTARRKFLSTITILQSWFVTSFFGAPGEIQTPDLHVRSVAFCSLKYGGVKIWSVQEDSNLQLSANRADALPLNYARIRSIVVARTWQFPYFGVFDRIRTCVIRFRKSAPRPLGHEDI